MQFPAVAKPPVGIVFDSAMDRIDEVLALAMLHGFDGKDQARIAAIAISRADLQAAKFCDAVRLFYASATTGTAAMFMHAMPVGLLDGKPAATVPMLDVPLTQKSVIKNIDDTADSGTLIRNSLEAYHDQNAAVVLSGPATDLAKLLDMYGAKDLIASKVHLLCLTETGLEKDAAAARAVNARGPSPVVMVGRDLGESLPFPGESIERDFAWATGHPVVDAYRAYKPMPYDAPSWAMAAMLYAARPKEGYFELSEAQSGQPRRLIFDPAQKERIIKTYIEMASTKPVPRKPRRPPDEKKDDKKDDKKPDEKSAEKKKDVEK
jgi:hypothetical protein